jgi:hypothetical protein
MTDKYGTRATVNWGYVLSFKEFPSWRDLINFFACQNTSAMHLQMSYILFISIRT